MRREIQLQARLSHVNIVELKQVGGVSDCLCCVAVRACVCVCCVCARCCLAVLVLLLLVRSFHCFTPRSFCALHPPPKKTQTQVVLTRRHLAIVMSYEGGGDLHSYCSKYTLNEEVARCVRLLLCSGC